MATIKNNEISFPDGKGAIVRHETITATTSSSGNIDIQSNATDYDPSKHIIIAIVAVPANSDGAYIAIPYVYNTHSSVRTQLRGAHIMRDGASLDPIAQESVTVTIFYVDR